MGAKQGFFTTDHTLLEDKHFKRLKPASKVLYWYLLKHKNRYQGNKSYFTRSDRQLASDAGLHVNSIINAKKELIASRFIICNLKPRKMTKYCLKE